MNRAERAMLPDVDMVDAHPAVVYCEDCGTDLPWHGEAEVHLCGPCAARPGECDGILLWRREVTS